MMSDTGKGANGGATARPAVAEHGRALPKRFYDEACVAAVDDGWAVVLDGRNVRTPGKQVWMVASAALAQAAADEWAVQADVIDPATMPINRLVNTALDGVAGQERAVRDEIVKFAGNDLLCYRADHPQELVARQAALWDPALAWLADARGVRLVTSQGIMPVAQPRQAIERFAGLVAGCDALSLAALHVLVTLSGSAVLGYGILEGAWSAQEAWSWAHVDEDWQIEQWGKDSEAQARRAYRWSEFEAAARILELVGQGQGGKSS